MYDPGHNIVDTNEGICAADLCTWRWQYPPEFEKALEGMNVNEFKGSRGMDAVSEYSGYSCTIRIASIPTTQLHHDAFIPYPITLLQVPVVVVVIGTDDIASLAALCVIPFFPTESPFTIYKAIQIHFMGPLAY